MQSNSETNTLLILILAVLLFGSGAVLGFFSTVFWIIVAVVIVIGLIWFIYQTPKIVSGVVEEQKVAYRKHPIGVILSFIIIVVVIIFWLISTQGNLSSNTSNTGGTGNLLQYQQPPTSVSKVNEYPPEKRQAFMKSCLITKGANQAYCSCALTYFETTFTIEEVHQLNLKYQESGVMPDELKAGFYFCRNKL